MPAGWRENWGEIDPEQWLAAELSLQGALEVKSTDRIITLRDTREARDLTAPVYLVSDVAGTTIEAAMSELSNGVWVVAYRETMP